MKLMQMTRDMRPYQANHSYLFPDAVADQLQAAGDATAAPPAADGIVLTPDAPAPTPGPIAQVVAAVTAPAGRYLTRGRPPGRRAREE